MGLGRRLKPLQPGRSAIPYVVLLSSLLVTGLVACYVEVSARAHDRLRFNNAVQRTQANIEERLNTYVALLRAGRGLFDVEERVSEDEFRAFIRPLGLRTQYPGVQGIGFSVRLSADEVSGSTARPRLQGSSTVTLRPAAPRDEYHAIVYLEPLDRRNQAAIGYDMFTEPVRRAAMEKARDTGLPSASGRVTLVQEIDPEKQAGFLIYLPVYEGGSVPADVSDRRSQLRGFIYSPFRVDDLIKGSLRKRPDLLVNFEIYDGLEIRPENLLHRSNRDQDQATRANLPPWLQETTVLYVAGRPWTFVFTGNAALEAASERRLVPFIVVIGGIVSLILFGLTGAQQRAWRSAKRSADRLQVSEAALLKANRQLNSILDRITDGFVALDPDFRFTYLNRASSELMKKTPEMVLGKTQWEAYPDLAGTAFEQQYRRAMEEQVPTEFEQYYAPLNIWVEVRAFPSSSGLSIYWRDISERKRAETALKEREATFQAFVSNVPGMVYRYAPFDEGGPRFTFVSSGALKLLELEPEALMADANAFFQLLYPEDLTSFHASVNYTAKNFLPWRWEGRVITPSGQLKWIQGRSTPMAIDQGSVWDGLFIDVTERKQAEQALEQTNQTLATLIDASPLSIVVIALDCTVRLWNPAATELFGWFEDEVLGKPLPIVPEEKQDECLQLRQTVGQGETVHTVETYRRRRDGSYVAVDVSAAPLCDESGEVVEIMLIWQDVTERLQAEAERERLLQGERAAREEAETANRIKDEFLAVLSHELRSPLNPILGWAKLLQERRLSEQASRQGLMTIERNAKLQTQLIEDLLDISRILRGKMALHVGPVNLVHTVEAALETVQLAADAKHLHIAQALDPEAASVIGDGARLQQIVWNLLSNAVKFTPEGGRIEVRLERVEAAGMGTWGHQGSYPTDLEGSTEPPRNALSSLPSSETLREHSLMSTSSGDAQTPYHSATSLFPRPTPPAPPHAYAQITVTDTGIGISPGFLPYVFDYFRQEDGKTTRRFGGLGLGLAIVRYLSELHGGMVTAASPGEGQGATFTVRLPLAPVQPPNGSASTAQQDVDLSHLHILVVDDEADMRALMQAVLQRYGARVSVAASAAEALALLDQLRPDVLVSDIGMPEVDGYTMMRQIRGSAADWGDGPAVGHRSLKAIALTAYAAETDQQQALAAGFQQHLAKPIEPEVLAQAILALAGKP